MLQLGDRAEDPSLALNSLAEGEEEALEDEHGAGAAQDGQGLARKEAEDEASKGCAQEALQHPLKCRVRVPGAKHVAGRRVVGLSPQQHRTTQGQCWGPRGKEAGFRQCSECPGGAGRRWAPRGPLGWAE